ncbi:MAG TPA: hypothetical protein VG711_10665 [Phycisphaerales bacterium]|nr:hypothetical protein [Phycisphaerales bacterium]
MIESWSILNANRREHAASDAGTSSRRHGIRGTLVAETSKAKRIVSGVVWALVFFGFGTWMLIDPHTMDHADMTNMHGRGRFFMQVLSWVWGVQGGDCV